MEEPAQAVHDYLCHLGAHLKEWDMKVGRHCILDTWKTRRSGVPARLPTAPRPPPLSGLPRLLPAPAQVDHLSGTVPSGTPKCMPKLEEYHLSRNRLVGTIPASWAPCRSCEQAAHAYALCRACMDALQGGTRGRRVHCFTC